MPPPSRSSRSAMTRTRSPGAGAGRCIVADVYTTPAERISFGDIFQSDHLIDVHVGAEARALGGKPLQRTTVAKIARGNNLELIDSGDPLPVLSPAMSQHPDSFAVLARGSNMKHPGPNRAILLADSCAADTALVVDRQGRRSRGRLLFAPVVVPGPDDDIERLADQPVFGRFPLAKLDAVFPDGAIVELRYCFMADVRDIHAVDRILALTKVAAEDLEVAWSAVALRRGPLATGHVLRKLAEITDGDPPASERPARMLKDVMNVAWRIEGGSLADAAESPALDPDKVARLIADLEDLENAARAARDALGADGQP